MSIAQRYKKALKECDDLFDCSKRHLLTPETMKERMDALDEVLDEARQYVEDGGKLLSRAELNAGPMLLWALPRFYKGEEIGGFYKEERAKWERSRQAARSTRDRTA